MAIVHLKDLTPLPEISKRCTPRALQRALQHIFSQVPAGLWLVGGTALAGYYAEHRRSDDLDLFANDATTHAMAVAAVRSLAKAGAVFSGERRSPTFYHVDVVFNEHQFTVDVVLDEQIHQVGRALHTKDHIWIPDFSTLFAMKSATLVGRCSEKDLFDLDWCFAQLGTINVPAILESGATLDGGLTTETLLIGLQGATLREEACGFVLDGKDAQKKAFQKISALRKALIHAIRTHEIAVPPSAAVATLHRAMKEIRRIKKS